MNNFIFENCFHFNHIDSNTEWERKDKSSILRKKLLMGHTTKQEQRIYIELPKLGDHQYHPVEEVHNHDYIIIENITNGIRI